MIRSQTSKPHSVDQSVLDYRIDGSVVHCKICESKLNQWKNGNSIFYTSLSSYLFFPISDHPLQDSKSNLILLEIF